MPGIGGIAYNSIRPAAACRFMSVSEKATHPSPRTSAASSCVLLAASRSAIAAVREDNMVVAVEVA